MQDLKALHHPHLPAGASRAQAEIEVLAVEAEAFIQEADLLKDLVTDRHGSTRHPLDSLSGRPSNRPERPVPRDSAQKAWEIGRETEEPEQTGLSPPAPLITAVGIGELRTRNPQQGVVRQRAIEPFKAFRTDFGVAVEENEHPTPGCPYSSVGRHREAPPVLLADQADPGKPTSDLVRGPVPAAVVDDDDLFLTSAGSFQALEALQREHARVEAGDDEREVAGVHQMGVPWSEDITGQERCSSAFRDLGDPPGGQACRSIGYSLGGSRDSGPLARV